VVYFKGLTEDQILELAGRQYTPAALRDAQRWGMVARLLGLCAAVVYACVLYALLTRTSNGFAVVSLFLLGSAGALPLGWADKVWTAAAVRHALARHTPLPGHSPEA